MSGSRRSNQGPRYDNWVPPEAQQQHTQYGNQVGIDHITAGISGVSLQGPPYGHGTGYGSDPYSQDGQYYQQSSYGYPQDPSYPSQEGVYSQAPAYPADAQYVQGGQYSTDGYDYNAVDSSVDPNSQYTTAARQQYPTHQKGKSRAVDQAGNNKPKNPRDKPRDRERDYGKGKSSAAKPGRSKPGKGHVEEDSAQDEPELTPFYRQHTSPQQGTAALDPSQEGGTATYAAPVDGAVYEDSYATTPQPTDDQSLNYEGHTVTTQEEPSEYGYNDPYANNDYQGYQGTRGGESRHGRVQDTHSQSDYLSTMSSEPYAPDPDDLASAIAESDGYVVAGSSHLTGDDSGVGASSDYTYPGYEDATGMQTPRATTPQVTIASTVGQAELDDRFTVQPSSRFYTGDVFKVLWSEPMGSGRADMTDAEARSHMGQNFYVGIRRFIIVRTDEGHSTCVPILTYERRACTKKGVKPRTHGIIYPNGSKPRSLDGEPTLGCKPVRIDLDDDSERIVKESRVNYAKLVTIEHNIRVFFIGRIAPEHLHLVNESVDKCWDYKNKISHSKGESGRKHYQSYRSHR